MNKQVLLTVAALALSGAAVAQPYGVVSVGGSRHDVDCGGFASCDKSDTAFKLLGGYKFMPNFAVEGGYFNFGKSTASDPGVSAEVKVDGFGIGGAFHQDLAPDWNFVARLGVASMKAKGTARSGAVSGTTSDRTAQLYGGLGVGYKLSKTLSLDAAIDASRAKLDGDKATVTALSVGLTFGF
jgi:OmpA-OmpF porin, OOP family